MESTRFLIVGGGITGLAFANFARSPDWLVVEREAEVGGYCRTVVQDGFVWDYSGHFFHFRHPEIERFLRDRMPAGEVETIRKSAGILYGGRRIEFPFQKNIHQLALPEFLECLHDLYFRDAARPIASFKDMLYARLGRGIAEKFLIPYNEKLYACDLDTLDVDAMGRFFPHADVADIIRNFVTPDNASYNATFTYPRGGAVGYVRALLADLPPERVRTGEAVVALDLDRRVATTTRGEIRYEHVVSSAPFDRLLRMAGVPHDPGLYTANKVLVFNLGFDRKGQARDHWLYVPDPSICFYRVGFYDNIFGTDRMSLYIEIGLPASAPVPDGALARVLEDLDRLGITQGHRLESWHQVVLDPAYVHITARSRSDQAARAAHLAAAGVHALGRYGGWTYCAIEDNIVEARALAEALS